MRLAVILVLFIILALLARQAVVSYNNTVGYGGTDLRTIIVGSRLLAAGADPYFTKWHPGEPERLAIPTDMNTERPVNGVTASPLMLKLIAPFSGMEYHSIRLGWWVIQQMLLFFCAIMVMYYYDWKNGAVVITIVSAAMFTLSPSWQIHFERGQVYLVYAAWIIILFVLGKNKTASLIFLNGCWVGFGIFIRLPLIVFAVPALFKLRGKERLLFVAGVASGMLMVYLLSFNPAVYNSYLKAMNIYTTSALSGVDIPYSKALVPPVVEGMNNLQRVKDFGVIRYFSSLHYYLELLGVVKTQLAIYILIFLVSAGGLTAVLKRKFQSFTNEQWMIFSFLLYELAEICLPLRAPYNPVQWLPAFLVTANFLYLAYLKAADIPVSK